jgi:hypothetical protein
VRPVQSAAGRSFIEPGSPWQNPFVESFGSRVRDEVLSVEAFDSVLEAQTVITDWRTIYNHRRPHSSLASRRSRGMSDGSGNGGLSVVWSWTRAGRFVRRSADDVLGRRDQQPGDLVDR